LRIETGQAQQGRGLSQPAINGGAGRRFRRSRGAALRIVVVALFAIVALLPAARAAPLSREAFTQNFVASLQAARPGVEIHTIRPLRLKVIDERGGVATANLENAFLEYRLDPADLESIVRRHMAAYASTVASERRPIDRARIVPVVKSRRWIADYAALIREQGHGDDAVAVHDLLNSELVVAYAEDRDETYRFLVPRDLQQLKIGRDALALLARDNLARLTPPPELITGPLRLWDPRRRQL
jgi:hypothetical protein